MRKLWSEMCFFNTGEFVMSWFKHDAITIEDFRYFPRVGLIQLLFGILITYVALLFISFTHVTVYGILTEISILKKFKGLL